MLRPAAGAPARWSRVLAPVRLGLLTAAPLWPHYLLMYAVGALHLTQVNLLDPLATPLIEPAPGAGVTVFAPIEAPLYRALDALWTPERVASVSAYYLVGFVWLLIWTPSLVAMTGDRDRLVRVLLTYPLLYLLALPTYLLLPQLNPYMALDLADPFTPLHGDLEAVYYLLTTPNNTFPSLHVAFTVALTAHLVRCRSQLLGGAAVVHGTFLVVSVVFLRVHWVGDVAGGLLAAWAALTLADRAATGEGWLGSLAARLDRHGRETMGWLTTWARHRG